MIRRFFRRRVSTFNSLVSLSMLAAMFVLFFLLMPEFTASIGGKVFVVVWTLMAMLSFVFHGKNIKPREGRQYVPAFGIQKNERTSKKARSTGVMGGS